MKVLIIQLCPALFDPIDYSPPGSSLHGILQGRILEWVAIPFSWGSSQLRNRTHVSSLQYPWSSLVSQLVKNPPAMQETSVRSLNWEDPLEKGKATHCSILAWRIHPWGSQESETTERLSLITLIIVPTLLLTYNTPPRI